PITPDTCPGDADSDTPSRAVRPAKRTDTSSIVSPAAAGVIRRSCPARTPPSGAFGHGRRRLCSPHWPHWPNFDSARLWGPHSSRRSIGGLSFDTFGNDRDDFVDAHDGCGEGARVGRGA